LAYDSREALSSSIALDDIKDVPTLPKGHYFGNIRRFECRDNVGDNNRTVVDFYVGLTRPSADVDPNKLDDIDLSEYELSRTFWFTPRGLPELRDFLRSFKIPNAGSRPLDSLYHETVGREVLCTISSGTYKRKRDNKEVSVTNLDDMVAVAEEPTTDLGTAA
jgi:hypothetical protein